MLEIERKFLVSPAYKPSVSGQEIVQGYLARDINCTVRIRLKDLKGYLTIKGKTEGIAREEFEYEIPRADAQALVELAKTSTAADYIIEKTRYLEEYLGHTFEVDVFHGVNEGLVIAEVELLSADELVALPPWIEAEVSGDPRYYNAALSAHPYTLWQEG